MVELVAEPDEARGCACAVSPLALGTLAREVERQHGVLERGQRRQQLEELEHDADVPAAPDGELLLAQQMDLLAVDRHRPVRRPVDAGDHVHDRATCRPCHVTDDRDAGVDGQIDAAQGRVLKLAGSVDLHDTHVASMRRFRRSVAWPGAPGSSSLSSRSPPSMRPAGPHVQVHQTSTSRTPSASVLIDRRTTGTGDAHDASLRFTLDAMRPEATPVLTSKRNRVRRPGLQTVSRERSPMSREQDDEAAPVFLSGSRRCESEPSDYARRAGVCSDDEDLCTSVRINANWIYGVSMPSGSPPGVTCCRSSHRRP